MTRSAASGWSAHRRQCGVGGHSFVAYLVWYDPRELLQRRPVPSGIGTRTGALPAASTGRTLLAPPVAAASRPGRRPGGRVVEIDPELADTAAMSAAYDLPMDAGANCVVVAGQPRRGGAGRRLPGPRRHPRRREQPRQAAARRAQGVVPPRWTVRSRSRHGVRRHHPGRPARRAGGCWSTRGCLDIDVAVIGSGVRRSKLLLPGRLLGELPGAEVVELAGLRGTGYRVRP